MAKIDGSEVLCSVGEMLGLELKPSEYVGTSEHLNLLSCVVFTEKTFRFPRPARTFLLLYDAVKASSNKN